MSNLSFELDNVVQHLTPCKQKNSVVSQTSKHGLWEGQSNKYSCIIVHSYLTNSVGTTLGYLSESIRVRFGLIDCLCSSSNEFVHLEWQTTFN